ncbi:MAG: UpxY family transcription antiterminator [Bacteroidia bacterium]|jgi:transcription antitermination factor NusG|nr:UpxY family transcription antiterminator [Bacteroidia bacterium]
MPLLDPFTQPQWHAAYVSSRAEKKVLSECQFQNIEAYLPLQHKLHQWSDRKKWVDAPLIPGYLFVHIGPIEQNKVLQLTHVIQFVRFERKLAVVQDCEIELLKRMLEQHELEVSVTTEELLPGKIVEITAGPMIGLRGELVSIRGKNKVSVRILPLGITVLIESATTHLTLVPA